MENRKIIMCKGLPCSGKSTWVKEFLSSHKNFLVWNRDTLRVMISAGDLSGKSTDVKEKILRSLRKDFIVAAFTYGFNVVLDDCNLAPSNMDAIFKIKEDYEDHFNIDIQVQSFENVPLETCLERNSRRVHPVPVEVIRDMYTKFIARQEETIPNYYPYNQLVQDCIILDLDGTIALKNGRKWYEYERVEEDLVHEPVWKIVSILSLKYPIFIMSGRDDSCKELSANWLKKNKILFNDIFMRKTGDHRKDAIIKEELWREHIKDKYNVVVWLDDRKSVIDHMRGLGLPVWEVQPGHF